MKIKSSYWLFGILLLAFVLRFWNLTIADLTTDDALYSFRALGWFDYLSAEGQTTPLQWFGAIPWWANFSFHDGPPLVFAIQKIFFSVFGDNTLAAKLPFALFGVATIYLVYLLVKELKSKISALLAAFLVSILSLHIWISHIGYLEGIEIFFITLTLWLLAKFINTKQKKFLLFLGVSLGLSLLTKYTALFLLPFILIYFLIFNRGIFKTKEFWLMGLLFLLVISPVIFYNYQVFITRGHLDAALSSMIGLQPEDFASIANRSTFGNPWESFNETIKQFAHLASWPLLELALFSVIFLISKIFIAKTDERKKEVFILLSFGFCLILFVVGGLSSDRFLSVFTIFLAIMVAIASVDIFNLFKQRQWVYAKKGLILLLLIVFGLEFFYSINSHFLVQPVSTNVLFYSTIEPKLSDNLGFNQLDQYLRQEVFPENMIFQRPNDLKILAETVSKNLASTKTFYFIDEAIHWFAYNWYFGRYQIYYGLPLGSLYNAVKSADGKDIIGIMRSRGIETFYFIYPVADKLIDPVKADQSQRKISVEFAASLEAQGFVPVEIKNHSGEVAFKIYKFN